MSDSTATGGPPAGLEGGPPVAPDLVPEIEQAAYRRPAPLWQSISAATLVIAFLASIVFAGVWANDRWGEAARVATSAEAFKALVSGDADGFLSLVDPEVRTRVKRADLRANEQLGPTLRWVRPRFVGAELRLEVASAGGATGVATFTPDPERGDLVRVAASGGPLGEATGTIQLARRFEGWRLTGFEFRGVPSPKSAPAE